MRAERLITENLELWTSAIAYKKGSGRTGNSKPELTGIKRLRTLILELAIRGKLVDQIPSEEPASFAFQQCLAGKKNAVETAKLKKARKHPEIRDDDTPFKLPDNWLWVRLDDLVRVINGRAYKKHEMLRQGTPLLRVGNLFTSNEWYYSDLELEDDKYIDTGDLIYAWSASFGPFLWQGDRAIYHYHIWKLDLFDEDALDKHFIYLYLKTVTEEIKSSGSGIAMIHMTKTKMEELLVAFPPLAEQHRIVQKVDELMALCDRLEQQTSDQLEAHETLVDTLLGTLTQSENATELANNWARLAPHFDTLFTTEQSIDKLKQTILQLAVMGRLVEQDAADEPAGELLKRIAKDKLRLVAARKLKKQKDNAEIGEAERPFVLPGGWDWARFGHVTAIRGELVRPEDFPDLRQVAPDCIQKGTGLITKNRTVKESGVKGPNSRFFAGQIIYSKIRPSLSKAALVDFDGLCSADMYPIDSFIDSSFLLTVILSEVFLQQVRLAENRIKMPKLNQDSLAGFVLPIPPLAEQHRIVQKVDKLMTLCDQLKERLNQAAETQSNLASASVMRETAA
jgi:type I restriction enzyme S subunit